MSFGIKVSKPGFDVNTANSGDTFMDTTYPILKTKQTGTGSLSLSDGGGEDSDVITHSLGYIPRVLVYGEYYNIYGSGKVSAYKRYPISDSYVAGVPVTMYFTITTTTTTLTIAGAFEDGSSNSDTFNYFYYIFYDEA